MKLQFVWFSISTFPLKSFSAVWLLQAIRPLRHGHGEGSAQTTGCLRGLEDNRRCDQNTQYLAIWLQWRNMVEHGERAHQTGSRRVERKRERETTGTPLCCTKMKTKIQRSPSQMNVFLSYFFCSLYLCLVLSTGLDYYQIERFFFKGWDETEQQEGDCKEIFSLFLWFYGFLRWWFPQSPFNCFIFGANDFWSVCCLM